MCDVGESQQQLLEKFEGSLVGPSIRPVAFTNPDGSEGTDFYLARKAFRDAFAADVDPETAAVMAAAQRPYAAAAFAATPSDRRRGRHCRAGTCSAPRTRRSRRRSSGSWPSGERNHCRGSRLRTSHSCPSPRPRPSSSCRPSTRQPPPADQRSQHSSASPLSTRLASDAGTPDDTSRPQRARVSTEPQRSPHGYRVARAPATLGRPGTSVGVVDRRRSAGQLGVDHLDLDRVAQCTRRRRWSGREDG